MFAFPPGMESDGNGERAEKVHSLLEWDQSLLQMQRSKDKQKRGSGVFELKQVKNSHPATFILLYIVSWRPIIIPYN